MRRALLLAAMLCSATAAQAQQARAPVSVIIDRPSGGIGGRLVPVGPAPGAPLPAGASFARTTAPAAARAEGCEGWAAFDVKGDTGQPVQLSAPKTAEAVPTGPTATDITLAPIGADGPAKGAGDATRRYCLGGQLAGGTGGGSADSTLPIPVNLNYN